MKYPLINEDEKEIPESIEREWLKKGKIRWKGQHNFDEIENGHACDVIGSFCTHLKWVPHSIPVIVFIFYFIYFFEQSHCLSMCLLHGPIEIRLPLILLFLFLSFFSPEKKNTNTNPFLWS